MRDRVRAVAARHPHLADLAESFPALLFALAVTPRGSDPEPAIRDVVDGRSLRQVAATAGVPPWMRRLPMKFLVDPLPPLPAGEFFGLRIVNHLPRSPKLVPVWLDRVAATAAWVDERFAVWIARELVRAPKQVSAARLPLMGLWAWFSLHVGTRGHQLARTPWHPQMHFKSALDAAEDWRATISLHLDLGEIPIADLWLQPGHVDGYDFVPLDRVDSIIEEAIGMDNCLCSYGRSLAHGRSRLWSIRRCGQRIATLQVGMASGGPLLTIYELRAARNKQAPMEVWMAAARWLHEHDLRRIEITQHAWGTVEFDARIWRSFWRPYWLAKRCFPAWLPLKPSRRALKLL